MILYLQLLSFDLQNHELFFIFKTKIYYLIKLKLYFKISLLCETIFVHTSHSCVSFLTFFEINKKKNW